MVLHVLPLYMDKPFFMLDYFFPELYTDITTPSCYKYTFYITGIFRHQEKMGLQGSFNSLLGMK